MTYDAPTDSESADAPHNPDVFELRRRINELSTEVASRSRLCWAPSPDGFCCDRMADHGGSHTWELVKATPPAITGPTLTFADLKAANLARCGRWHLGFPDDESWSGADWSNALGGEAGELIEAAEIVQAAARVAARVGKVQNTMKKIRRYETGTNTVHDKPLEQLWAEFDAEMADVACYLDLLATKYGRDLAGAIAAKFNAVSARQDFPERLVLA